MLNKGLIILFFFSACFGLFSCAHTAFVDQLPSDCSQSCLVDPRQGSRRRSLASSGFPSVNLTHLLFSFYRFYHSINFCNHFNFGTACRHLAETQDSMLSCHICAYNELQVFCHIINHPLPDLSMLECETYVFNKISGTIMGSVQNPYYLEILVRSS